MNTQIHNLAIRDTNSLQIYGASEAFICDEDFSIMRNGAILFEKGRDEILCVSDYDSLTKAFPHTKAQFFPNGVLIPALINAHIHFEFGNNISQFVYGDFGEWLDSLMTRRENVLCDIDKVVNNGIIEQLSAGVGSVGAISSYGDDALSLSKSPLRVVFFNEAIGSNPAMLDTLYAHFLTRLESTTNLTSQTFTPAIALHSPYSLHPSFATRLIEIAKKQHLPLSAHFLESIQEYRWLTQGDGYFVRFFQTLAKQSNPKPFYTPKSFLDMLMPLLDSHSSLSLTHCLQAQDLELEHISQLKASIITCPRSNRLLTNAFLNRQNIAKHRINIALGTDGKSSNNNVNMLDEMRTMLYAYPNDDIIDLSKEIIKSATLYGARALGLNNGCLQKGKNVDFAIFDIVRGDSINTNTESTQDKHSQSPLQFILQAKKPKLMCINAKLIQ